MNYESSNQSNQSYDEGNRMQQREGKIARAIESQTAKLPSDIFLWAAGAAVIGSLAFQVLGPRPRVGLFVLIFGLYNKIVKVAGSDRMTR